MWAIVTMLIAICSLIAGYAIARLRGQQQAGQRLERENTRLLAIMASDPHAREDTRILNYLDARAAQGHVLLGFDIDPGHIGRVPSVRRAALVDMARIGVLSPGRAVFPNDPSTPDRARA